MSKQNDGHDRGVELLKDERRPLGERVQRLVDTLDGTNRDGRDAIVEYGTQIHEGGSSPEADRRLEALVRLARRHGIDVRKADFQSDTSKTGDDTLPATAATSDIVVEPLDAQNGCIAIGERYQFEVTLRNRSGYPDERPVGLRVDGDRVHETEVVLGGGSTETLAYTVSFDAPGEYYVEVGGREAVEIEVLEPASGPRNGTDLEELETDGSVPVTVHVTERFDRPSATDAVSPVAEQGAGTAWDPTDERLDPVDADRCEFLFDSDSDTDTLDTGGAGIVVVDEQPLAIVRLGSEPVGNLTDESRRSLESYVRPFLTGLEFETEIVEVPTSVTGPAPPVPAESKSYDGDAATDPITVAVSECREALADAGPNPGLGTDRESFVVTRLDPEAVSTDGFVGRIRRQAAGGLLPWTAPTEERTAVLRELGERVETIEQVLRPLDLSIQPVESQRTARGVLARVGIRAD
ncbi:hypothetical protein SAMN05216388_102077 [Halorientalis persicus]|uniref:CARDB protein n=1 Tax=Halorientalis persicus TaxID=1367881 RepID=A0A1H8SXT2_9EURY|nr:hypothetical protein [Halorientalis persicus]SEO83491.1 hypothetical protein SAMN05216388_102077 [Halorientalis persicus]